jgi:hypothetical protein
MAQRFNRYLCLGFTAIWICLSAGCAKKDDAAAIRQLIDQGARLAEEHQIGALLKLATKDFTAMPGPFDAAKVKGILFMAFQHYGAMAVHYPRPSVEVAGNAESASATIHFIIVSKDKPLPRLKELYDDPQQWLEAASEKADLYQLELAWVKTGGDWRVRQAELKGFKGWGF